MISWDLPRALFDLTECRLL